jgi:hypothetical protein
MFIKVNPGACFESVGPSFRHISYRGTYYSGCNYIASTFFDKNLIKGIYSLRKLVGSLVWQINARIIKYFDGGALAVINMSVKLVNWLPLASTHKMVYTKYAVHGKFWNLGKILITVTDNFHRKLFFVMAYWLKLIFREAKNDQCSILTPRASRKASNGIQVCKTPISYVLGLIDNTSI